MNRPVRMLLALMLVSSALPIVLRAQTAADSATIRAAALAYAEGWYSGDAARMQRALHPELVKRIIRGTDGGGHELPYGRGVWVGTHRGTPEISHGGATAGYRAWLGRFPEFQLSVVLLCNGPANDVALAGHFEREKLGTPFTVSASSDSLRISGEPALQLGPDHFGIPWGEFRFEGRDVLHELAADGSTFQTFRRVDGPLPLPESLSQIPGRYRSEAALATYVVSLEAGQLEIHVEDRPGWFFRYMPIGPDVFRSTGSLVRAHRDGSGRVVTLSISTDRLRDLRLTRIE